MKLSKIVLIAMSILTVFTISARYNSLKNENLQNIKHLINLYSERVRSTIKEAADVTEVLDSLLVASKGSMQDEDISTMMSLAYNEDIHIAIAYMPNGIITRVYPLHGNESSLGYNVFNDVQASADAIKAMDTNEITFSGPYMLMIGIPGLVARNPVYYEKDGENIFWGFIATIIKPSDELIHNTGLKDLEQLEYEYSIQSNYNDLHVDLYTSKNFNPNLAEVTHTFEIGNSTWIIEIYKENIIKSNIINTILPGLAMVFFTLIMYLALSQVDKKHNIVHIQSLTDPLTNLNNRRSLDKYEETSNKRKNSGGYTIFYIDLNMFKPVNDKYGHDIGDKLLSIFSERLISQFRLDTFLSRVGGDEFVVIFPTSQNEVQCTQVKSRLLKIAEDPFFIEGHEILISCSIGSATYPEDGETFAEVLKKADNQMFLYKQLNKKNIER